MSVLDHQTGVPSGGPKGACLSWTTQKGPLWGAPWGSTSCSWGSTSCSWGTTADFGAKIAFLESAAPWAQAAGNPSCTSSGTVPRGPKAGSSPKTLPKQAFSDSGPLARATSGLPQPLKKSPGPEKDHQIEGGVITENRNKGPEPAPGRKKIPGAEHRPRPITPPLEGGVITENRNKGARAGPRS